MMTDPTGLEKLVAEAIHAGAEELDIEYKDGYDEVCVMRGPIGFGIARFRRSSSEGIALREELFGIARRSRRLSIGGRAWDLRCRIRDSFARDADLAAVFGPLDCFGLAFKQLRHFLS